MHRHGKSRFKIGQTADSNFFESIFLRKICRQAIQRFFIRHNQPDVAVKHFQHIIIVRNHDDLSGKPRRFARNLALPLQVFLISLIQIISILPPSRQYHHIGRITIGECNIILRYGLPIILLLLIQQGNLLFQTAWFHFQFFGELVKLFDRSLLFPGYHRPCQTADTAVCTKTVAERQFGIVLR